MNGRFVRHEGYGVDNDRARLAKKLLRPMRLRVAAWPAP
jgi:hypothetical protein